MVSFLLGGFFLWVIFKFRVDGHFFGTPLRILPVSASWYLAWTFYAHQKTNKLPCLLDMPPTPAHARPTWIQFWKEHGAGKLDQQNWKSTLGKNWEESADILRHACAHREWVLENPFPTFTDVGIFLQKATLSQHCSLLKCLELKVKHTVPIQLQRTVQISSPQSPWFGTLRSELWHNLRSLGQSNLSVFSGSLSLWEK